MRGLLTLQIVTEKECAADENVKVLGLQTAGVGRSYKSYTVYTGQRLTRKDERWWQLEWGKNDELLMLKKCAGVIVKCIQQPV